MDEILSFGLKYYFFKKILLNNLFLKLLPNLMRLGHVSND